MRAYKPIRGPCRDCGGPLEPRRDLGEQLKPLACQRGFEDGEAGDVAARAVEPRHEAAGDGIGHAYKDDRDRPRLPLEGSVVGTAPARMMSGCRPTNPRASARIRLMSPAAQ